MAFRIVIAHELHAYREVLAAAVKLKHPGCETILVHPDELDATLEQTVPDIVIAPASAPALATYAGVSLLLHATDGHRAVLSRAGQVLRSIEQAGFSDILSMLALLPVA